jgi:hypothetical protein
MSPGEYCRLSGPADVIAILGAYIVPDAPDAEDPEAVKEQDYSSEPDFFG